jgi:hypothetical protein
MYIMRCRTTEELEEQPVLEEARFAQTLVLITRIWQARICFPERLSLITICKEGRHWHINIPLLV